MRACLVIGRQGTGKTLLCLRLTEQSGINTPFIEQEWPTGIRTQRAWTLREAHSALVGVGAHSTIGMQTFGLGFSQTLAERFLLQDSTGLEEGVHADLLIRMGMARTLSCLATADCVLHVIDGCQVDAVGQLSALDEAIHSLAQTRGISYCIALNKSDQSQAQERSKMVRKRYRSTPIYLCSALTGTGVHTLWQVLGKKNVVH